MYLPEPASNHSHTLELLSAATESPATICSEDPETRIAFEEGLRALAEDIIQYHPGLAHILIGMSETTCPFTHGQN
jgi:hypothetical protein